jgi:hypothetical protein
VADDDDIAGIFIKRLFTRGGPGMKKPVPAKGKFN